MKHVGRRILQRVRVAQHVMRGRGHQIIAVRSTAVRVVQGKDRPGGQLRVIAGALEPLGICNQTVNHLAGAGFADTGLGIVAVGGINLDLLVGRVCTQGRFHLEVDLRLERIIVEQRHLARRYAPGVGPTEDGFGILGAVGIARLEKRDVAHIGMAADAVAQHHFLGLARVVEVIVNAVFLKQAADEGKVRLAILHTVFPGIVRAGHLAFHARGIDCPKDILDDVDRRHGLIDPVAGAKGRQPVLGPDFGGKDHITVRKAHFLDRDEDAGDLEAAV